MIQLFPNNYFANYYSQYYFQEAEATVTVPINGFDLNISLGTVIVSIVGELPAPPTGSAGPPVQTGAYQKRKPVTVYVHGKRLRAELSSVTITISDCMVVDDDEDALALILSALNNEPVSEPIPIPNTDDEEFMEILEMVVQSENTAPTKPSQESDAEEEFLLTMIMELLNR